MAYASEYLSAVVQRGRVKMPPHGFEPNWADAPRYGKLYPGAPLFPLPPGDMPEGAALQEGLLPPLPEGGAFDLDTLSGMLLDSYGRLGRRIELNANDDVTRLHTYTAAKWTRGTASGGGLYPVSLYWVSGASGPMTPGVYYYATPHHAMQRLLTGDVSEEVRAALGHPQLGAETDQFLVLGIKFWQSSFKYNNFSYHATTMDIGTVTQTWRMWARARGLNIAPAFWFDERRLTRLLGVDGDEEGIFAVVPLPWGGSGSKSAQAPASYGAEGVRAPAVRLRDQDRSRVQLTFELLRKVHADTREGATERPAAAQLEAAAPLPPRDGGTTALPAPRTLGMPVRDALRARRSSFGRFSGEQPLAADELSAVLAAAHAGGELPCDALEPGEGLSLAKLYVFVNHVDGVAPGAYEYDPAGGRLVTVVPGPQGSFLQRNYFLSNYNVEQAAAVVVPAVRGQALIGAVGGRGFRVSNAVTGAVAQATYTACAALGVGCGAALGFDNVSYIEQLGLDATGEVPLLILMVGHERPNPAGLRHEIV
ncbi:MULTISPECIES: SagB family peptide dehydrogenase [Streptomyces]|uniref:SagB family peptide dehydrogenase n=1 Tax=Streptomyces TaxID=1883 RepID=UPI001C304A3C|nr:SagB family peptide dehydrogenase [Streptomyces sp. GbtcB7]